MPRKRILSGIALSILIAVCVVGTIGGGLTGWFFLTGDDSGQSETARSRILPPLSPANQPTATLPSQPNLIPVTPTESPASTVAPPSDGAPPQPTITPTPQPLPTDSSQALGLPRGSVNAVTQQGLGTKLVIPKLNLEAPIILAPIENGTWAVEHLAETYVGHLEGTAPAGANSNMVLAAHVTVSAGVYGPFAGLSLLEAGDEVLVYKDEQAFRYRVDGYQIVDQTSVEVTYPTNRGEITLITCSRWSSEEGRYLDRLVVKGELVN